MKKLLLLGTCALLAIASCKKDDDDDVITPVDQKKEYLTTGTWKVTAASVSFSAFGLDSTIDAYAQMPSCLRDNFYSFNDNGTSVSNEGATKCMDTAPQTSQGSWQLLENNTKLSLSLDGAPVPTTFDILELNANTLRIAMDSAVLGGSYSTTVTYSH